MGNKWIVSIIISALIFAVVAGIVALFSYLAINFPGILFILFPVILFGGIVFLVYDTMR